MESERHWLTARRRRTVVIRSNMMKVVRAMEGMLGLVVASGLGSCGSMVVEAAVVLVLLVGVGCFLLRAYYAGAYAEKGRRQFPPGPRGLPVLGSWLQFPGGVITPETLGKLSRMYGDVCMVKLGWCNLVVVSSPEMAKEVLHTRAAEFGSRSPNFVFDLTSGGGQDMVFADYGPHWRKMRRLLTPPFFSKAALKHNSPDWEEEIDLAIHDISKAQQPPQPPSSAPNSPTPIAPRLQLAIYNILYRMAFNTRFDNILNPLYQKIYDSNMTNGNLQITFQYNIADFFPMLRLFFRSFINNVLEANQERHRIFKDIFIAEHAR